MRVPTIVMASFIWVWHHKWMAMLVLVLGHVTASFLVAQVRPAFSVAVHESVLQESPGHSRAVWFAKLSNTRGLPVVWVEPRLRSVRDAQGNDLRKPEAVPFGPQYYDGPVRVIRPWYDRRDARVSDALFFAESWLALWRNEPEIGMHLNAYSPKTNLEWIEAEGELDVFVGAGKPQVHREKLRLDRESTFKLGVHEIRFLVGSENGQQEKINLHFFSRDVPLGLYRIYVIGGGANADDKPWQESLRRELNAAGEAEATFEMPAKIISKDVEVAFHHFPRVQRYRYPIQLKTSRKELGELSTLLRTYVPSEREKREWGPRWEDAPKDAVQFEFAGAQVDELGLFAAFRIVSERMLLSSDVEWVSLRDDTGRDLMKPTEDLARHYVANEADVQKDGSGRKNFFDNLPRLRFRSRLAPAPEATELTYEGVLHVRLAGDKRERDVPRVELKAGEKFSIGDVTLEITRISSSTDKRALLSVTEYGDWGTVQKAAWYDAEAAADEAPLLEEARRVPYTFRDGRRAYQFMLESSRPLRAVKVKATVWENTRYLAVPFKLKVPRKAFKPVEQHHEEG